MPWWLNNSSEVSVDGCFFTRAGERQRCRAGADRQRPTKTFYPPPNPPPPAALVPSGPATAVIDLYLLCWARATGPDENNVHEQELQWNQVKNGAIMLVFFPSEVWHCDNWALRGKKLQLHILSYPSICGAHSVPGVILWSCAAIYASGLPTCLCCFYLSKWFPADASRQGCTEDIWGFGGRNVTSCPPNPHVYGSGFWEMSWWNADMR